MNDVERAKALLGDRQELVLLKMNRIWFVYSREAALEHPRKYSTKIVIGKRVYYDVQHARNEAARRNNLRRSMLLRRSNRSTLLGE